MSAHLYVKSHLDADGVTGWVVRIGLFRATNIKKADRFGKSDPYVLVYINGVRRARSTCLKRTLNPYWEQIMEFTVFREDWGSSNLSDATLELALFDMDKVGKHDFLGGVQLRGADFMNFAAFPLPKKPAWEISSSDAYDGGDRLREFELMNFAPHEEVHDLRGKMAFWAEIRPDEESERFLAALKIQSLRRGSVDRAQVKRQVAARKIQARQRGKMQRRHFEKTKHAYLTFSIACGQIKKWADWNDLALDEIFADMDRDGDGGLTVEEIKKFFGAHPSVELLPEDIDAILFHMDPNQDGTVDEAEFLGTIRNSDEITDNIRAQWDGHLKQKEVDLRVRDMGRAWRSAARARAQAQQDGVELAEGQSGVGTELAARRRRRASRWSAEFEHRKAQHTKKHAEHAKKKLTAEERRVVLHTQWRRESTRRLEQFERQRGELQQRLFKEQSERLRTVSSDDEIEDEMGLGNSDDDDGCEIEPNVTHAGDPRLRGSTDTRLRRKTGPGLPGHFNASAAARVPRRPADANGRRGGPAVRTSPRARRISPSSRGRGGGRRGGGRGERRGRRPSGTGRRRGKGRPRSPSELAKTYKFYSREIDMKTKRIFYQNYNTGETVWKLPEGAVIFPPLPKPETPKPEKISPFTFDAVPARSDEDEGVPGSDGGGEIEVDAVFRRGVRGRKKGDELEALAQSLGSLTAFDFRMPPPNAGDGYDDAGYGEVEEEGGGEEEEGDEGFGEAYDDDY
jgi:hypothetical protein